ncbi:putative transcriptional regulator [Kitasatospora setae KM-6054]|uniref:Putative transcriptional regulator n=1 Tax=Kitasatospora setae (strain ATCC 33774 / DSM 43861 / JCM 3304 / KCC A-0304 / NBRC 14216 / KM-6054) TaxID=452652 RepID=E4N7F1_KITSK|nr:putative transcriptional regulator [Kitasatospora setae KM-6054]
MVQALEARLEDIVAAMADLTVREIPFYRGPTVSREALCTGLRGSAVFLLTHLADRGAAPYDVSAPTATGRTRALQGAPLADVLRVYRLGFAFFWEQLLAESRTFGEDATQALLAAASRIWVLADAYSTALTDSYREAAAERMVEADRRRSALVAALLDGPGTDGEEVWETARLLGFPPQGRFLVAVAETTSPGEPPLPGLQHRLHALDTGTAWRARSGCEIGILSLPAHAQEAPVLDALRATATGRVGLSPLYRSLDHTRRCLRYAQVALDSLPPGRAGLRQLDDTPLTDLVLANLDSTRRAVNRVLGGLLCLPDNDRTTLLATARAWLGAHGSATDAAAALYCHPNTVRYRLRRLEEHLRGSLEDPLVVGELAVALDALGAFPTLLHDHQALPGSSWADGQ